MHITILALGSRGDILPLTALGKGLKQRGHKVRFITFESFREDVVSRELDFHSIPGDARLLVMQAGANMPRLIREFSSQAKQYTHSLSDQKLLSTDLIINQLPGGLFGYDLAEKAGVMMIQAAVIPMLKTSAFPLMNFPALPIPGWNRFTYWLGEKMLWAIFKPIITDWRKKVLRLPPIQPGGYFDKIGTSEIPVLLGFSEYVVPKATEWGENVHITGSWLPETPDWAPSQALLDFLQAGEAPVFIGFGSMPVQYPIATTTMILEALEQTGQRGIISSGWGGMGQVGLPEAVYNLEFAPYDWLFPQMKFILHHGGSGTTAYALRSGKISGVISFVFDQQFWGKRIADLNAGPPPEKFSRLTIRKLADMIREGCESSSYQYGARKIADALRRESGIETAIEIIERIGNRP